MTQPRSKRPNWTEAPPADWAEEQAHRIAGEVNRLRGARSAQWLADRTKELGHEVSRSVIADLENGRRRYVTTAELVVLAAALDTSPVTLVFPGPYNEIVDALPHLSVMQITAAQWFSGLDYFTINKWYYTTDEDYRAAVAPFDHEDEWRQNGLLLSRWRRLLELELLQNEAAFAGILVAGLPAEVEARMRRQAEMYAREIADLRREVGYDPSAPDA